MQIRSKVVTIALMTGLAVAAASPASAVVPDVITPVSVTLTGGVLALTAPTTMVNLGSHQNSVQAGAINGSLGIVQVSDARSAAAGSGWIVSVISTALTPSSGPTIGAALIGYTVGSITQVGTATYVANNPANLTGVSPAITATGITGDNSATWNPTINVTVPGGMAAGLYTGSITHSLI